MRTLGVSALVVILLVFTVHSQSQAQWVQTSSGLTRKAYEVSCLAVSGTNLYVGTYDGVFRSTDNGVNWSEVNTGMTYIDPSGFTFNPWISSLAVSGTNLFAGMNGNGIYRSTDSGSTWTEVDSGLTRANGGLWVSSITTSGIYLFAGTTGAGVFRSSNNGMSWNAVESGLTRLDIWSIAASGMSLYAGSDSVIFISTDNGTSWRGVSNGLPASDVWDIAFSDTNLYVSTYGGGIFCSTNNGTSWSEIDTGIPDDSAYYISGHITRYIPCLATYGTRVIAGLFGSYAGDGGGIWLLNDVGSSWKWYNTGLPGNAFDVTSLAVSGPYLFSGTWGSGIWRRASSDLTSVNTRAADNPALFVLEQNYPNPFNPTTTIRYAIPQRSHVMLTVFNTLGQQAATLVDETQEAGYHNVRFDGTGLASGVYIYRLQAGSFVQSRKLVLLR